MSTNVIVYRRFSTDEQEKGDSLARQTRSCDDFAKARGWTVSELLTDKGRSAFKGEHLLPDAELGKLVARAERGELHGAVILAERLDRLSRRPVQEAMAWLHNLTKQGVHVAIADKGKVFGPRMSLEEFLGAALSLNTSNEESEKKSERVRSALLRRWELAERREGRWTNLAGRVPLWLRRHPDGNDWIIDIKRVDVIADIYRWSADGLGVPTITQRLNARGEKPWGVWRRKPGDLTWGKSAVRALLLNPAVEGDFVPESGLLLGRVLPGFYPRIIDADLVARARGSAASRKKAKGRRASSGSANLFAGLTVCGECGRSAFLTSHLKKGKLYRYIRCEGAGDGRACDNSGYYAYEAFETAALDLCVDLALDDRFFEASGEVRELRIQEAEIEKAIADKAARRERLMRAFDDDDDQAVDLIRSLKTEIAGFRAQLAAIKADIDRASGKVGAVEHLQRVNDIRDAAGSTDPLIREQARAKLRQAMSAIINRVSVERQDGQKVFTLSLSGGVMGAQFDTRGRLVSTVTEAVGRPLWEHIAPQNRAVLEPLIRRLQSQQTVRA